MVSKGLRFWFVVHFVLDVSFAIPLLLFPIETLKFFGWTQIDPLSTRLVGAALMGIGVESFLGRNATVEAFRAMLNLKVIWSLSAVFGITLSMIQGGPPVLGWAVLAIFGSFCILWISYRLRLSHRRAK